MRAGLLHFLVLVMLLSFWGSIPKALAQTGTTKLRVSLHIFQDSDGHGNFSADSTDHVEFLRDVIKSINFRLMNLDTLKPEVSSPYVKSLGIQISLDSIFYHTDNYAWDCSKDIDSDYMRLVYVDKDSSLNYRQKFRTLPVFLGGNYDVVGGHNSLIGDKWFIAMRGMFSEYMNRPYSNAVGDCGRGLLHELGHSLGLSHNFKDGPHGQQCDKCEDNGCPYEGSSNNIMDYWPSYGYAISACQKEIVWEHLNGFRGNIAEVIWNDSCFREMDQFVYIEDGDSITISDTSYLHSDLVVRKGGSLIVNSYLSVPGACSIIIESGANLYVENGTIGNLCGDIWEGVFISRSDSVLGGKIDFINARLENAKTALTIESHPALKIDHTGFFNNLSSLRILGWQGKEKITNCRFIINNRLNHWEEGLVPGSFVWLKDIENIVFESCLFYNTEGHRNYGDLYSGIGIISNNSSLGIDSCKFENLFKGLVVGSDSLENFFSVDACSFSYNHCCIQLAGITKARISSSSFNLNKLNTVPVYGIYARHTKYLEIERNDFYSDYGGDRLTAVVSDFKHPGTHLIHNNTFSLLNEGLVVLNSDDIPLWPMALLDYSYLDLIKIPLGSVWYSNQFINVKKKVLSVDSEGGGILKSNEGEYEQFSLDWSKAFKGEGYGSYATGRDICIIRPFTHYNVAKPSGILFHILSDESWFEYDSVEVESGCTREVFYSLVDEYVVGVKLLQRNLQFSHEGMVLLAAHIEKYPWLVYTSQFGQFLVREIYVIPGWIWKELIKALEKSSWWKNQLHQFIISIANNQFQNIESNSSAVFNTDIELFSSMAFEKISVEISTDIGRLNPGIFSDSSFPAFTVVPNPSRGKIGIKFKNEFPDLIGIDGLEWVVRDMFGRIVSRGFISGVEDLIIDAGVIPSGSYLIEIWDKNEFLGIQKFIILPD